MPTALLVFMWLYPKLPLTPLLFILVASLLTFVVTTGFVWLSYTLERCLQKLR